MKDSDEINITTEDELTTAQWSQLLDSARNLLRTVKSDS